MKDQVKVCPLSRGVMLPCGSIPIRPITGRHSLLPPSPTRTPIGSPCSLLSLTGGVWAYHVPLDCPDSVGAACPPVPVVAVAGETGYPSTGSRPFWVKPVSIFGLFIFTAFSSSSHTFAMLSTPSAPTASMLAVTIPPHGFILSLSGEGYIVPRASHHEITSVAGRGRRPVTAHRLGPPYEVPTAKGATSCRNQFQMNRRAPAYRRKPSSC